MYLIFAGRSYYPSGGANDLVTVNDAATTENCSLAELVAINAIKSHDQDWSHVYCTDRQEIIAEYCKEDRGEVSYVIDSLRDNSIVAIVDDDEVS